MGNTWFWAKQTASSSKAKYILLIHKPKTCLWPAPRWRHQSSNLELQSLQDPSMRRYNRQNLAQFARIITKQIPKKYLKRLWKNYLARVEERDNWALPAGKILTQFLKLHLTNSSIAKLIETQGKILWQGHHQTMNTSQQRRAIRRQEAKICTISFRRQDLPWIIKHLMKQHLVKPDLIHLNKKLETLKELEEKEDLLPVILEINIPEAHSKAVP